MDGHRLRCLNIVDNFTKECLAIEFDTSLPGHCIVAVLERLAESRGLPRSAIMDNDTEFISKVWINGFTENDFNYYLSILASRSRMHILKTSTVSWRGMNV
ncbi:integrase catalytic domain-containing protein [Undibacterium sp. SXout7W]|uniref:integrase catalytic domain-containing protein n=1 Tax=Undibacterium sp. SXout7W TaxID=3413049 RepID=UPI003BF28A1A